MEQHEKPLDNGKVNTKTWKLDDKVVIALIKINTVGRIIFVTYFKQPCSLSHNMHHHTTKIVQPLLNFLCFRDIPISFPEGWSRQMHKFFNPIEIL